MGSGVVQCRDIRFGRFGERILHQFGGVCDERYELRKLGRHIGVGLEGESLWLMSAVPYPLGGCRVRASEKAPHVACHPMGWCEVIPLISVEQMVSKLHDDISTRPFLSLNGEEAGEEGEIFRYANNGSHAYKKAAMEPSQDANYWARTVSSTFVSMNTASSVFCGGAYPRD